jgi:hypothetical protein
MEIQITFFHLRGGRHQNEFLVDAAHTHGGDWHQKRDRRDV